MRAKLIYEKFVEDSDPIRDLNIGLKFAYVKPGDIIANKEYVYLVNTKYEKYQKQTRLTFNEPESYRFQLRENYYSVIVKTEMRGILLYLEAIPISFVGYAQYIAKDINNNELFFKNEKWKYRFDWWSKSSSLKNWEKYFTVAE